MTPLVPILVKSSLQSEILDLHPQGRNIPVFLGKNRTSLTMEFLVLVPKSRE